ncbi:uncharacterized protein LOC116133934 [Pistacia vera]|uniref:uncharacterized protein LOC116133934 n=1 Tax=Pistacia vera TaxID=55513 RepID=UPI001263105D|nr:uncharacterized protein LOC116133934 [Pistacia vera]
MAPSYQLALTVFLPTTPNYFRVDQHLSRLRASQATSTSSISHGINGLQDLHDCVDKLLQLASIQQALAQDELLTGSLRLLDICGIAKDSLVQTKEAVQGLQSIFRRRRCDDIELTSKVKKYLTSRKTVKMTIQKALKNLKAMKNQRISPICEKDESNATICILREVEAVTFNVIESLLSLISGPKVPSKLSSWSVVSKLIHSKKVAGEETEINEFENLDAELSTIIAHKTSKSDNIQNQLKELESSIQDFEDGLESLSRRLIKTRVSLLNILNN